MKLMEWRRVSNSTENSTSLELWMTVDGINWYHYTNPLFNIYRKPNSTLPKASKGYTTAVNCLKLGFKYIPTRN